MERKQNQKQPLPTRTTASSRNQSLISLQECGLAEGGDATRSVHSAATVATMDAGSLLEPDIFTAAPNQPWKAAIKIQFPLEQQRLSLSSLEIQIRGRSPRRSRPQRSTTNANFSGNSDSTTATEDAEGVHNGQSRTLLSASNSPGNCSATDFPWLPGNALLSRWKESSDSDFAG
jgi:hypothetical protein